MPGHRWVCCLLPLALAGCAAGQTTSAAPGASSPAGPTTSSTPTTVPTPLRSAVPVTTASQGPTAPGCPRLATTTAPFTGSTAPSTQAEVGSGFGLQSATAGLQPGYDRVVFRLAAGSPGAKPGWRVSYVTTPTSDGSGNPVPVAGSAFLEVGLTDVGYPADTGVPDPAVKQLDPPCTRVVRQVVLQSVFEGRYTAFIGLRATRAFRVFRLANPARLVVDVRHS